MLFYFYYKQNVNNEMINKKWMEKWKFSLNYAKNQQRNL